MTGRSRASAKAAGTLPLSISEADFQAAVIDLAKLAGWRIHHSRPTQVRNGRWATALTGHPGLPDLVMARAGVVLMAELKTEKGVVSDEQRRWLDAIGGECARIWRPSDWPQIYTELAA